ncbi:MAG: hypothetical protein JEZ03_05105 [Bacteroidales bacterium]|nr:hypothetical protein [Bacteroidales bacterium]
MSLKKIKIQKPVMELYGNKMTRIILGDHYGTHTRHFSMHQQGKMTKDLALLNHGRDPKEEHYLCSIDFLKKISNNLYSKLDN